MESLDRRNTDIVILYIGRFFFLVCILILFAQFVVLFRTEWWPRWTVETAFLYFEKQPATSNVIFIKETLKTLYDMPLSLPPFLVGLFCAGVSRSF